MLKPWKRYPLVVAFSAITTLVLAQPPAGFDVVEASVAEIHSEMKAGKLTSEELVRSCLARIKYYDQSTKLNAIVVVNNAALERAKQLDREFRRTQKLLPLHGIPVIVKDNYDTHDLQTSAGSPALKGSLPPDDAFQVRLLREAGAIVLAKSNMAEWAYSANFTVSGIAGTTLNPYDLTRVPAGSSGGTAAAIAASFGTVGVGTDTGNSIRGPSAHCCLVGIRPTLGLTSRDGIVPLFLRNDVGGPMCRTVEDTARVLQVISGFDPKDPVTKKARGRSFDFVSGLRKDGLKGARVGVFRTLSQSSTADAEFGRLFETAIADIRSLGAEVVDPFTIEGLGSAKLNQLQDKLWIDTFRYDIGIYLKTLGEAAPIQSFEDILRARKYGPFLNSRLNSSKRSIIPAELQNPSSADVAADSNRRALLETVVQSMDRHRVDAFLFPTWNNPPRKVGDVRSPAGNNSYQLPPHTGQPAITVPMGFNGSGLPAGLQWVGRPFSEATLLRLAYAYEQATRHRKAPKQFAKPPKP